MGCLHISDTNVLKAELSLNNLGNTVMYKDETYIIS